MMDASRSSVWLRPRLSVNAARRRTRSLEALAARPDSGGTIDARTDTSVSLPDEDALDAASTVPFARNRLYERFQLLRGRGVG